MQNLVAERSFYEQLFVENPENEHIHAGYEELHDIAFQEDPGGPVLDLGCGTGAHSVRLARRGFEVIAVDLMGVGVRAARARLRRDGLAGTFIVANAQALPVRDGAVSVTWASLLLHHFPEPKDLLPELARVTRHRLIAFEPNAGNLLTWFAMNVVNRFWGLPGMTRNQRALGVSRLTRLLERHGFERRRLEYVHRPWQDRLSFVRRLYTVLVSWLPIRFRANKVLVVFERRQA